MLECEDQSGGFPRMEAYFSRILPNGLGFLHLQGTGEASRESDTDNWIRHILQWIRQFLSIDG
jgi:hypothetical protein